MSSGGLYETGKDAVGFQSAFRSGSEADLAEDDEIPERLFCMIIRGWYAWAAEKGKEKFLFGSDEITPESLGGFETKRLVAEGVQFCDRAFFDFGCLLPVSQSRQQRLTRRSQKGPTAASFSVFGRSACSPLISLVFVMM